MPRNLKTSYWPFEGGLDLRTPNIEMKPGRLLGSQNYEIGISEGYRRIDGYERFSGLDKPSDASYWILDFDVGDTEVTAGQTVEGGTSAATGIAVIDGVLESGTYAGGDAVGYLVLYDVTGTFQDNEDIEVSSSKVAESASIATSRGADSTTLDTTYYRAAIEATRADISAIPGSGAIRGVHIYSDDVYAFRDNTAGSACTMYKSTTSGWAAQDLGYTIDFDAGTTEPSTGVTLTGTSSGASGTIQKLVLEDGTWAAGTAEGYMVLYSEASTPFNNNEAITTTAGGAATAAGVGSDNALTNGGNYEFVNYNFTGHTSNQKMYGVNGLDKAFEWDGSTFSFIPTGMTADTPNHLSAHLNYLWLSFPGGSLQYSGIGDPTSWSVILGAGELGIGDEVTAIQPTPGMLLTVFARNSTHLLKGSSPQDWFLREFSPDSGAIARSVQHVQEPTYLDDRGITRLSRVENLGDFNDNIVSDIVQQRFDAQKSKVTTSVSIKNKNQYIIYFNDNTAMQCTFRKGKLLGWMDLDYNLVVRCTTSGEDSSGNAQVFFGSDDGYIYELNKGTSFDGESIGAFLRLSYNHFKSPYHWKKFRRVYLEMGSGVDPNIDLEVATELSYSDPDIPSGVPVDVEVAGGGGFWNSTNWNQFYWSGQAIGTVDWYIDGDGQNLSLLINSDSTYENPHTIHGATVHYSMRGMVR